MDPALMTPEEYAARIANSLAAGQNAPGLTPGTGEGLGAPDFVSRVAAAGGTAAPSGAMVPPVVSETVAPAAAGGGTPGQTFVSPFPADAGPRPQLVPPRMTVPTPAGVSDFGSFAPMERQVALERPLIRSIAQAEAEKAKEASDKMFDAAKLQTERQNSDAVALAEIKSQADALRQDILNQQVDPDRLWKDKSAGKQAASVISIIMGGIGSGLTGGPNVALAIMDRQIERDINAQTAELGKKQNALSGLMQQYNDVGHAQQALRIALAESSKMRLDAGLAKMDTGIAKQRGELLSAEAGRSIAAMQTELAQKIGFLKFNLQMMDQARGGAQYENPQYQSNPRTMDYPGVAEARNADLGRTINPVSPGGKPVLAHDTSAATAANARLVGIKSAYHLLSQIEAERGPGNIFPWSNDNVAAEAKLDALAFELARAYTGGVPGESSIREAKGQLRGPFSAYIRGSSSYQPVLDILESQKQGILDTYAPGIGSRVSVPSKPVK
jgi:hypothetical protein